MRESPYAPFYDFFKLIVTILLLLLFLFLAFWIPSKQPLQSLLPSGTPLPARSTPTVAAVITSPTATSTSLPPTATSTPQATPPPTETTESVQPTSAAPTPTETSSPEATSPPVAENPANENPCPAVSRAQLQVGTKAVIQHRLNFRSSVGIHNNRLSTNPPGTQVDVVGGPECTAYENGSSYLWWQIKLPNGEIGWSAEASAFGGFYFMEPAQ